MIGDFSVRGAADELGVSDKTLRRWIKAGYVPFLQLPNRRARFTREQLTEIRQSWPRSATSNGRKEIDDAH